MSRQKPATRSISPPASSGTVMFGALIRAAERWRSVKVTEFKRRQMTAVRNELDLEYEAAVGLKAKPSKDDAHVRLSSNSWT